MKRRSPILAINAVLADPRFIIGLNVAFGVVLVLGKRLHIGIDATDFGMSWTTMAMDQIIIAASWIGTVKMFRYLKHIVQRLDRIEAKLND